MSKDGYSTAFMITVAGQGFFVMEDGDIRTHHIHIVKWNGAEWKNYTAGKQEIIDQLLSEASIWKLESMTAT